MVCLRTLIVRVALAVPPGLSEMLVELRVSLGPEVTDVAESETVPANALRLTRVIVTVLELPRVALMEVGLAVRLKSWTFTVTTTECPIDPLVPVTLTA